MKPKNFIILFLSAIVILFTIGCKKTLKENTYLPKLKGGFIGENNFLVNNNGEKIEAQNQVFSNEGNIDGLSGLAGFDNLLMNRDVFASQTVYFGFDRTEPVLENSEKVTAVADALSDSPKNKILVEGHCDERGTEEYNRALGEKRALSIRDILVEKGISPNRIRTMTFGEDRPADPNLTESAYRLNRRGEFVLLTSKPDN
jgi:outer membrane protein OmpA-like peptidoglycan-associated protein